MGLFSVKENKTLEAIIFSLRNNMSNNYKDATLIDLEKLENLYKILRTNGDLNSKQEQYYGELILELKSETKGFNYKNQAPQRDFQPSNVKK